MLQCSIVGLGGIYLEYTVTTTEYNLYFKIKTTFLCVLSVTRCHLGAGLCFIFLQAVPLNT